MKKCILIVICFGILSISNTSKAGDWFFSVDSSTYNFWSNSLINGMLYNINRESDGLFGFEGGYKLDLFSIENHGQEISEKMPSYWGLKARDLFGNFDFGVKVGFQPESSIIGVYGRLGYDKDYFIIKDDQSLIGGKYKGDFLKLGGGLKFCAIRDNRCSLYLDLGTCYNINVKEKSPYGKDCSQFNNGLEYNIKIGVSKSDEDIVHVFTIGLDIKPYNYFNKAYSYDNGLDVVSPYKFTKTRNWCISLNYTVYGFLNE